MFMMQLQLFSPAVLREMLIAEHSVMVMNIFPKNERKEKTQSDLRDFRSQISLRSDGSVELFSPKYNHETISKCINLLQKAATARAHSLKKGEV